MVFTLCAANGVVSCLSPYLARTSHDYTQSIELGDTAEEIRSL